MFKKQAPLQCPVCESPEYTKVRIELPDGEVYGADVYKCAMCSYRFINRSRAVRSPSTNAKQLEPAYK